jgi:hypothetical protein
MSKAGRPVEYTPEVLERINEELEEYIETGKGLPSVTEFAFKHDYRRASLYDHEELSYNIEKVRLKRELALEKLGFSGKSNATMAIFSLKQLGWRDKQEIEHVGAVPTQIVLTGPDETASSDN